MKRILVFVLVLFAHFTITMVHCFGQDDKQLANAVENIFKIMRSQNFIFNYDGRWYFATAVANYSFSRIDNVKQASREKTISFFIRNGIKKYSNFTHFPQNMTGSEDIEDVYILLKGKKKNFYDMPEIAKFKISTDCEVYVFAKPIVDAPNKSVAQNNNVDFKKPSYNSNTKTLSTITQNRDTSPVNNTSNANQSSQSITLVVYGTANTKDEAVKTALRSAIEQAFGTFVSSNTKIVNDELTKDEIVSVTSGNIENYSIISSEKESDGKCSVSVKATVSIGKLLQFAQSKGAATELAGATFAMNMKMRRLNKENEYQAICHMLDKMIKMSEQNLFDYEIRTEGPQIVKGIQDLYGIPTTIIVTPNNNYTNLVNEFKTTIKSLSLSEEEKGEYIKTNEGFFEYKEFGINGLRRPFINESKSKYVDEYRNENGCVIGKFSFTLRNRIVDFEEIRNKLETIRTNIWKSSMSFKISDNLGNYSMPICVNYKGPADKKEEWEVDVHCDWPIYAEIGDEYRNINVNLYGITSSKESHNRNFMGGSKGTFTPYGIYVKKAKYYNSLSGTTYKEWQRFNGKIYCRKNNKIFNQEYDGWQSCLDYSGKTYPYYIYLFYNEEDLSNLNLIKITPVSPSDFLVKNLIY